MADQADRAIQGPAVALQPAGEGGLALGAQVVQRAVDLQRQDADRLLSNRRFLEDRFGSANAV